MADPIAKAREALAEYDRPRCKGSYERRVAGASGVPWIAKDPCGLPVGHEWACGPRTEFGVSAAHLRVVLSAHDALAARLAEVERERDEARAALDRANREIVVQLGCDHTGIGLPGCPVCDGRAPTKVAEGGS